jgi:hypothetical protein
MDVSPLELIGDEERRKARKAQPGAALAMTSATSTGRGLRFSNCRFSPGAKRQLS